MLDRTSAAPPTLAARVMAHILGQIESRTLAPGARLPSVRDLAAKMGMSKSTVVEAYDRLIADGAITARRGSGFYVAGQTRPLALKTLRPELDRAIDPLWITRQSLTCGPEILKPGRGWLPESWMPDFGVQKALRQIARDPDIETRIGYDTPLGYGPLREQLAVRLAARGIEADPEQIMLTDSASHAVDLLCRFLVEPGATVLVDDPCYFNFRAQLMSHRIEAVGIPFGYDGPDVAAFEHAVVTRRPRFYLTNSGLHNPTGASVSTVNAHRILQVCERHDVLVIEDDAFADLEMEPAPRLCALDGFRRVMQVGSYSKTVSAASRCGYVVARPDWIDALVDLKIATNLSGNRLGAILLHRVLTDGTYHRHVDQIRAKLARHMAEASARIEAAGLTLWCRPKAGMFVWARLPDDLDAADIARYALKQDVIFAPGNMFSPSHSAQSYMRFNVAQCGEARIFEVLRDAMDAVAR